MTIATASTPTMRPIKFIFLDIPAGVAVDETIDLTKPFHDFMALLSLMSGSVCTQIKGLVDRCELKESGLNLSEGCWWYRVVKITSTQDQEADQELPQHTKGEWRRLATLFAYDQMREHELAAGLPLDEGWVEVQHDLQKTRDESTAAKAREQDENWRSSIGHTRESPQDDSASRELTSASASLPNTSNTSLQLEGAEDVVKNCVTSRKHVESDSVGSCSSTEQVKQLIEEYTAQAHPLVVEWPRPPRCTLIHLNEDYVAEDAESRNHNPVLFASFDKDEEHAKGLPTYTPRPGPFPAQIGKPPSTEYCAYEIRNDIEYHPDSPDLEDARIRPAESHALHDERYHGNNAPPSKAPVPKLEPLQTSISLPEQHMHYDMGSSLFERTSHPMQSAPAHVQSFAQVPWAGMTSTVGYQKSGQRFPSQESYHSQSSGRVPYQGASYFGSGSYGRSGQQSGYLYQPQSSIHSPSGSIRPYQYHAPPLLPFGNQSAVRHSSYPPPPQDVVPQNTSPGASNYQYGYGGPGGGIFPTGPQINFDALKESEILSMTAQAQQDHTSYQPSPEYSRQSTPNPYLRSNSATLQTSDCYPSSRTASRRSSRVVLPGFSSSWFGTEAPTFTTANAFSQSFDVLTRELGPVWSSHGAARDPAMEANHQLFLQSQMQYGNDNAVGSGPATGRACGKMTYPMLSASHGQSQNQRSDSWPKQGKQPFNGKFSPPKPRMEGKTAAKVLDRYNRAGSSQNRAPEFATTGGFMEHSSSGPPSLSNVKVVFPVQKRAGPARRESSDQISSSPSPVSTASNFSDDFILNDSGKSKKKNNAKVKSRKVKAASVKRGAAKETDAVKKVAVQEIAKNERDSADARAARIKRRSSGKIKAEAEAAIEGQSMMIEG